ncbi:Zinc finger, CCHC-type [Cucumis melo var. makuwa]|uniref:Zinc finger, CCHC-type n=1 Tax=Cucumis melo var. makuwa TaxID=1194695 RepID=A0A5D3C767_CUCMM|nr:Zinc finger, CCHC-type [Cucumis melo var. makuwa]
MHFQISKGRPVCVPPISVKPVSSRLKPKAENCSINLFTFRLRVPIRLESRACVSIRSDVVSSQTRNPKTLNLQAGQSVNEYLAVLQPIWTQLDQAKISKDHLHLIKVLMGLLPEYESVRAALLHRSPLFSLDAAIQEILFEEKRLGINLSKHSDVVLASIYSSPGASSTFCKNCKLTGHKFIDCLKIECRNSSVVAATSDNLTTLQFQISDLQSLLNQLISSSSSAPAVSPSSRWLLDSACCNHMTSNYSLMNTPSPAKSLPPIYAADGNCLGSADGTDDWDGSQSRKIV